MSYTKQNFKSGEKLYASDLNEMDEQIYQNTETISQLSEEKADKENTYTKAEVDEKLENIPSGGGGETWRIIREFTIENEEAVAKDTESGITWTVDDSGNITAFEFDTSADGKTFNATKMRIVIIPKKGFDALFGGKRSYLHNYCNGMRGILYNATAITSETVINVYIEPDNSGRLYQTSYIGGSWNSYGNEALRFGYFKNPGYDYEKPPIKKFKMECESGVWFTTNAHIIVQICEEVS